ncbi:nucleoside recognition domain-containing protein [Paenibacillus sp. URB8-2]|uniref:nucleoside recognition domain-containing protein n=1 Tax=Paenibacillus sp. URB8-2 TaxID=2741301 RepID=UPI0015B82EEE|nr:nucleoside recognition domain-containing protein [Paenibacillus sp. URB8-2]BCG59170.1 sporulation integral membrane protein YlbJ [Paenibacillus sp. URB8-2]
MNANITRIAKQSAPFLSGGLAMLLATAIISSPESSFNASLQGLKLWWTLVFPALLPFLMLSEMLSASGFVHAIGVLLEPLMKLVFRLPGSAGWTLALGMTSGFPGGAHGAVQLHQQGEISGRDAGRLASLAHFASPVTLLIVVGAAMLHSPAAGYGLLAVHWVAGLAAGMTISAGAPPQKDTAPAKTSAIRRASLIRRAASAAADARARDGRSFGRLLGESVSASVQSLMLVGGYMIIFAVVISIVTRQWPMLPAALPASLLEIHLGAQALTTGVAPTVPGLSIGPLGLALLSGMLGWSGICAQLQALTVLRPAGARFLPFAAGRLLHGGYAFLLTLLLYKPLTAIQEAALPAFAGGNLSPMSGSSGEGAAWSLFPNLAALLVLMLLSLLILSATVRLTSALHRRFR